MNEKQKKKLSKLLAKWGVGEEELKDFLLDLDNEPDEEDEEEVVEEKVDEEKVEEVEDEPKGEEVEEKTEAEEVEVDGDEKKVEETEKVEPDGEVDEKVEVEEKEKEEKKELEVKNEEYEAKIVELQDALNGLENRIASLESGLMKAGVLVNTEVKEVGVGADNEAKGEIVAGSREDLLARLNGRR